MNYYSDMNEHEQCAYSTGKQIAVEALCLRDNKDEDFAASEYAKIILNSLDTDTQRENWIFLSGFISELMRFIGRDEFDQDKPRLRVINGGSA